MYQRPRETFVQEGKKQRKKIQSISYLLDQLPVHQKLEGNKDAEAACLRGTFEFQAPDNVGNF
jgi:hypothetical protein